MNAERVRKRGEKRGDAVSRSPHRRKRLALTLAGNVADHDNHAGFFGATHILDHRAVKHLVILDSKVFRFGYPVVAAKAVERGRAEDG